MLSTITHVQPLQVKICPHDRILLSVTPTGEHSNKISAVCMDCMRPVPEESLVAAAMTKRMRAIEMALAENPPAETAMELLDELAGITTYMQREYGWMDDTAEAMRCQRFGTSL